MARVLLLTPPQQAVDVAFLLEEEGHEPCFWPVLGPQRELAAGLRAAAEQVHRATWVVALGTGPLLAFFEALNQAGTKAAIRKVQWLASDAAAARAIERQGATVRVPGDGKWTSAVSGLLQPDDEVLVLHSGNVPDSLLDALEALGARFTPVNAGADLGLDSGSHHLDHQVVIVHSAAAAEAWVELSCGRVTTPREDLRVVATAPGVTAALQSMGVPVFATARGTAADAVVDVAIQAIQAPSS